jgi:hypothetical protein
MIVATAPSILSVDFSLSGLILPAGSVLYKYYTSSTVMLDTRRARFSLPASASSIPWWAATYPYFIFASYNEISVVFLFPYFSFARNDLNILVVLNMLFA